MATALTVYLQSASASSTISTANKLIENSTGGSLTNKNSNLTSGTTGWIEMWSQGNASAQTGGGSEPAPDARGWCDDGTVLETNQFASGTWTATIQLETTVAGTFTTDIHVRAYQRSSGGTYTLIAEMVSTGQSVVNTAFTTYTVSATGVAASNTFATGDKLYIDILLNITTNATTGNMRLEESSSATLGNVNAQIVTPGYQTLTVNTMSSTDSLTVTDSTLVSDVNQASTPQPLTTYVTSANSTRLGTAELLVTGSGASSTSASNTIGTQTGWGELGLGGPQATFGGTDIGNPSGLGAYLDSRILEGNQVVAGNYSGTLTLSISESGKAVNGVLVLRFYKYNTGSTTYTAIGTITLTAQTINSTSATAFNFPNTALPSMTFASNESLYVDAWLDITSNTMDASGALSVFFANSSTQGYSGALFATPGYIVSSDVIAVSDIGGLQSWNVDALTAADTALYIDSDIPVEALTAVDAISATVQASATDALTTSDSLAKVDVYLVSDANTANDIGGMQTWNIDALSIADSTLNTDALIPVEALTVSDVMAQSDGYTTLEALTVSDATNTTDSAALVDVGSVSDIGGMQTWNVDGLSANDALLGSDAGSFAESNAVSDNLAQSETYQPAEALNASDALTQVDGYAVIDTQSVSDSFAQSDAYLVSDVQSIVDALLGIDGSLYSDLLPLTDSSTMVESPTGPTTTTYSFTDALSSADLFVNGGTLLVSDSNATSDNLALAMQFMALDTQSVADLLAQSGIYQVSDAQSVADFFAQSAQYQVSDSQSITDVFALALQYIALDTQGINDSVVYLYIFPATEANSVSDALISADAAALLDQVAISDRSVLSGGLVSNDLLQVADQFGVVVALIPIESLSIADPLLATDSVVGWVDRLSIADLFSMISTISIEQTPAIVVALGRSGNAVAIGRNGKVTALGRSGKTAAQGR